MAQFRQLRALTNVKWPWMWRNTEPSGPVPERNWSAVTAGTCGEHEIKCSFTAKDMTLKGCEGTKRSCLMDEGLAWARYHDNNRQVQPHLHVSKVKNCDFRLGVFRVLSLTGSWAMFSCFCNCICICPATSAPNAPAITACVTIDQSAL